LMNKIMFGIYVHIPFCLKKCDYCDFYSIPCSRDSVPEKKYLDAVIRQLGSNAEIFSNRIMTSVYFGGGTPSLMSPEFFAQLLESLKSKLKLGGDVEVSCEVNPKTVDAAWFDGARRVGITRASIGVQSFSDELLGRLGRVHTAEDAMQAIAEAQDAGFDSVGVDLMFGIPGESVAVLEDDVRTAMTFQPRHISAYQLTIEEGTPLYERLEGRDSSLVTRDSEDEILEQMRIVARMLSRGGWSRYEISNFAKPGFECRHNMNYWRYGEYLGLGAGATSFLYDETTSHELRVTSHGFGRRWTQVRDVKKYMKGTGEFAESEEIDLRTAMAEFCFLGLRTLDGIDAGDFEGRFGRGFEDVYGDIERGLVDDGLILRSKGRIMLSAKGIELSNQVFERFLP
jgi:oxygen-independent coproporphyrinogen-3 oxidase